MGEKLDENKFRFGLPSENLAQILPESVSRFALDPDPDPHSSKMLDPQSINADPKHWFLSGLAIKKTCANNPSRKPAPPN
jgi:hypothetical protein